MNLLVAQAVTGVDPMPITGQTVFTIVISLAVLGALAWFLRRGVTTRRSRLPVSVETAVPLGERRSLVIVAVEGRRLLLGLTPAQVTLVTELQPPFSESLNSAVAKGASS